MPSPTSFPGFSPTRPPERRREPWERGGAVTVGIGVIMHQSIPAVPIPPPPGQPRGICSSCQSRGWGIHNFIAARGLGISLPRGDPRAFDTRVRINMEEFIGKDVAFVKDWLVRHGLEKLVDVLKGMFSQF